MDFHDWIYSKYRLWSQDGQKSETQFAVWLGVSQALVNAWFNRSRNKPRTKEIVNKLFEKFGNDPEIYAALDLSNPNAAIGISIPLLGRITAGDPVPIPPSDLNYYDWESRITILKEWLPENFPTEGLYALEVQGESMKDIGIYDGSTVVLKKQETADNGDIVAVCLDDENSATIKRFYRENGHVRLQPANAEMQPIVVKADMVHVVGKLVMAIRTFV
jgi:SOS regulatory protein LexA